MNNVILIGRLTKDPELRYGQNSMPIAHFTLAVDRPQQGQERQADFIRITVFGKQAETVSRYLSKGRQAAIHGRIQTGSYQGKDGQTVYTTDVIADRVEFLGGNNSNNGNSNGGYQNQHQNDPAPNNQRQGRGNTQGYQPGPQMPGGSAAYTSPTMSEVGYSDSYGEQVAFVATDDDIPF